MLPRFLNLCPLTKKKCLRCRPQRVETVQSKHSSSFRRSVALMHYFGGDVSCFYSSTFTPSSSRLLGPPGAPVTTLQSSLLLFKLPEEAPEQHSITMETSPLLSDWPLVNKEVRAAVWCLPLLKVVTVVVVTSPCQRDKKNTHLRFSPTQELLQPHSRSSITFIDAFALQSSTRRIFFPHTRFYPY